MNETNLKRRQRIYSRLSEKDGAGALALCSKDITFQLAGKSSVSGKRQGQGIQTEWLNRIWAEPSFRFEVHDILASDRHGIVLASSYVSRNGKETQMRLVHVWRIEEGSPVAWYEYPRDLYQFDALWPA